VFTVNAAAETILAVSRAAMLAHPLAHLTREDPALEEFVAAAELVLAGKEPRRDVQVVHGNGARTLTLRAASLASPRKRSTTPSSARRCAWSTFAATSRPSEVSVA